MQNRKEASDSVPFHVARASFKQHLGRFSLRFATPDVCGGRIRAPNPDPQRVESIQQATEFGSARHQRLQPMRERRAGRDWMLHLAQKLFLVAKIRHPLTGCTY